MRLKDQRYKRKLTKTKTAFGSALIAYELITASNSLLHSIEIRGNGSSPATFATNDKVRFCV